MQPRLLHVKLDSGGVSTRGYALEPTEPTRNLNLTMGKGDVEQILVTADARRGHHTWWLELPCVVDGRERSVSVSDREDPFVTVGAHGLPSVWYDGGGKTEDLSTLD